MKNSVKMFRLGLCFISTLFPCYLIAAPYGPGGMRVEWTQPDGTRLTLKVLGDEFYARTETADGYTVVFDPGTKTYFYAGISPDGSRLRATDLKAGSGAPSLSGLAKHLSINPEEVRKQAQDRRLKWEVATQTGTRWKALKDRRNALDGGAQALPPQMAPPPSTTTGNKVGLTLLIDFDDDPASVPQAEIVDFLNSDNFTGSGNNGSVKKYFQDNSNNLLTYTNVVTAYIRIPNSLHPKSYYNDTSQGCGTQAQLLIRDAITIMKSLPNYNSEILPTFNSVTVDGDNQVMSLNVFYAGGNGGLWAYGLWPHYSAIPDLSLSSGGKKLFLYQITNIGSSLEIGTFCHENGHMLCGFPDVYDYDYDPSSGYDSVGGAGVFCLMGHGVHATDSNPAQVSAYLKRAAGWAETIDLTSNSSQTVSLVAPPATNGYNRFFRYAKPGTPTEYFLIENRQSSGRDANLPASGIAVWHIDELGNHSNQSLTPNTSHANYEVTLVQADNLWHFQNNQNSGDSSDLYHAGNSAVGYTNMLTDSTSPNSRWWDGSTSGLKMANFSANSSSMTVEVGWTGENPPPVITSTPATTGNYGLQFNYQVEATNSPASYGSTALPEGLALDSTSGLIFGIPTVSGTFTVNVSATNPSGTGSANLIITIGPPPPAVVTKSLDTDPGWSRQGQWAFGVPAGGGGTLYGNADPSAGATGEHVFGVNLSGDYSTSPGGPYYLIAGPFDLSSRQNTVLRFQRWLNIESQAYAIAMIDVSTDGQNWTRVWNNGQDTITDSSWHRMVCDIAAVADRHETVYLRWGYQVNIKAWPFSGWNIDDIEILADLWEPTPLVVTTADDENDAVLGLGTGDSLREVLAAATISPGRDVIHFSPDLSGATIVLAVGQLAVTSDVTIDASTLTSGIAVSGDSKSRVFQIPSGTNVDLVGVTVKNGFLGWGSGSGILNSGNLSLKNVILSGNRMDGSNWDNSGAGVFNDANLEMENSTVSGNSLFLGNGGGIGNSGDLTVTNCTITGNFLDDGYGAGIHNTGNATVRNSTISGNNTYYGGPGVGISSNGSLVVENSIVAGNPRKYGAPSELTGSNATFRGVNILSGEPRLAKLDDYGGPVPTMPPLAESPAIDAGVAQPDSPATDQRGLPRISGTAMDIGAVELNQLIVTTVADESESELGSGAGDSLREVILAAGSIPGADLIRFAPILNGGTITLGGSQITVDSDVMIDASTLPAGIIVSGNSTSRVFEITDNVFASIFGLTVTGGNRANPEEDNDGGGIYNRGSLALDHSLVSGNSTIGMGGGILTTSGKVHITNSSVVNNHADLGGGGIMNYTTDLRIEGTTISSNSSGTSGGGIGCSSSISFSFPQTTLMNCTLFNNTAADKGGGYWGYMASKRKGNLNCINTTFSNNTAGNSGGAIYTGGNVILNHCTVAGNSCRNDLGDLSGDGGGIFDGGGTGMFSNLSRLITLTNSVVAGNFAVTNPNIQGEIDTIYGANLLSGDPKLAPLALYGWSTATMPPLPNSPAIDTAVQLTDSPATDQRGEPRSAGPRPDLGAVEAFPFSKLTLVDVDNDGFDDRLEPAYQMTVGDNNRGRDWDGDGSSDAEEIANMTDPFDSSSLLRIISFLPSPEFNPATNPLFDVTFTSFPGLDYSLECDSDISFSSPSARTTSYGTAGGFTETVRMMLQPNRDFVRVRRDP